MKIIFDHDHLPDNSVIAVHSIDTADPAVFSMLQALQANKVLLEAAGYNVMTKIIGAAPGTKRWHVIVDAANSLQAEPALRALNLTK